MKKYLCSLFGNAVFTLGLVFSTSLVQAQSAQDNAVQKADSSAQATEKSAVQSTQGVHIVSTSDATIEKNTKTILNGIKEQFESTFQGIEVDEVRTTPFAQLYEVRLGSELLYTNKGLDFVLQGSLVDVATLTDLTAERVEELNRVHFSDLPLEQAITQVKGDGSREIVVFEDPNCIYCKRLHETFAEIEDITIHTLLFPILTPDSRTIAEHVWCAENAAEVWSNWMVNEVKPEEITCDAPIDDLLKSGLGIGVQGTPAIFFADGSRVNGWMPADKLEAKLQSADNNAKNASNEAQ